MERQLWDAVETLARSREFHVGTYGAGGSTRERTMRWSAGSERFEVRCGAPDLRERHAG